MPAIAGKKSASGVFRDAHGEDDGRFSTSIDAAYRKLFSAELSIVNFLQGDRPGRQRTVTKRLIREQIRKVDQARALLIEAGKKIDPNFRP